MAIEKIQLSHPEGKKAPAISLQNYQVLEKAIKEVLNGRQLSHTDLAKEIHGYLEKKKIKFEGSVDWFGEWVKLHLLSKGTITVNTDKGKKLISLK